MKKLRHVTLTLALICAASGSFWARAGVLMPGSDKTSPPPTPIPSSASTDAEFEAASGEAESDTNYLVVPLPMFGVTIIVRL